MARKVIFDSLLTVPKDFTLPRTHPVNSTPSVHHYHRLGMFIELVSYLGNPAIRLLRYCPELWDIAGGVTLQYKVKEIQDKEVALSPDDMIARVIEENELIAERCEEIGRYLLTEAERITNSIPDLITELESVDLTNFNPDEVAESIAVIEHGKEAPNRNYQKHDGNVQDNVGGNGTTKPSTKPSSIKPPRPSPTSHNYERIETLIIEYLISNEGVPSSKSDILDYLLNSHSLPLSQGQWNSIISTLVDNGTVTRTGQKRGTRYSV